MTTTTHTTTHTTTPHKATWDTLRAAEAAGRDSLLAFIRRDIKERDERAFAEWENYALYCPTEKAYGDPACHCTRNYTAIVNPQGKLYPIRLTQEAVKVFEDCPAQPLIDAINASAKRQGIVLRVESKHGRMLDLLQTALRMGVREWKWFPAIDGMPAGYYSVPVAPGERAVLAVAGKGGLK